MQLRSTVLQRSFLAALTLTIAVSLVISSEALADVIWVDWHTVLENGDIEGTATVSGGTVTVTYSGERSFVQTECGINYWNPPDSYLSDTVPNQPPDCDIIALSQATAKTLTFSEPVANVYFAVVSLNGNGYRFDRDFDILSYGCGYWGCGTLSKQVSPPTYDLIGTGEPHGVIQLLGEFSSVSWTSLTPENWNGFSIGFQETVANLTPSVSIEGTSDAAEPASNGEFTVSSSLTAGTGGLTVFYSVDEASSASASDFSPLSGSVVIEEGQTTATIPIIVQDDSTAEDTESLILNLMPDDAYEVGTPATASIDILDNDEIPPPQPPPTEPAVSVPTIGTLGLLLLILLTGSVGAAVLVRRGG